MGDVGNVFGGAITTLKIGGSGGTDLGYTRGGLELARSVTDFLSEVDQATAHVDARIVMNELMLRTTLAEAVPANLAYAWNIAASAVTSSSSLQVLDSGAGTKNVVYFEAPGPDLDNDGTQDTYYFHGYRGLATGSSTMRWARDADVDVSVEFRLLLDSDLSPARFADMWIA